MGASVLVPSRRIQDGSALTIIQDLVWGVQDFQHCSRVMVGSDGEQTTSVVGWEGGVQRVCEQGKR